MDRKLMMAVASALNPISALMDDNTGDHYIGKGSTPNKYKPHQGKKERERRLKYATAAWHSNNNAKRNNHYQ